MRVRAWMAVVAVLTIGGCGFEPTDAAPLLPPDLYRTWWARTEDCSGLQRDFADIHFYVVPGTEFDCPSGKCVGRWEPGNHIYIAESHSQDEMVVRHEMLHALIGEAGHPDPPFGRGCGLTYATWRPSASAMANPLAAGLHID